MRVSMTASLALIARGLCVFALSAGITACVQTPRLISAKSSPGAPKKILIIRSGDISGAESARMATEFQDVSDANVVLNPKQYIDQFGLGTGQVSGEALSALYKEEIAQVVEITNLAVDHAYVVSDPVKIELLNKHGEITAYDGTGAKQTVYGPDPYGSKIVTWWWHMIDARASGEFIVYDTESASQVLAGSFPVKSSRDYSSAVSLPKFVSSTNPLTADWSEKFFTRAKSEGNPVVGKGIQIAEEKAVKRFFKGLAKLPKSTN